MEPEMVDGIVTIPLPGHAMICVVPPDGESPRPSALGQFLAGPENRLVEPSVRAVLERRAAPFNPLVLYGPSGTGKSHLARGLAAAWKSRFPGQRVAYAMAADFARELADAIEAQAIDDFRHRYREAALAVFEDLADLVGKDAAQEELLHTLDALLYGGAQVVVTARTTPGGITGLLPGLQSRLTGGLTVPISPPGPAARLAIVQCLAQLREIDLAEPVAQLLADGFSGTVPELLGALLQLEVPARHDRQTIDARAVRQYLAERSASKHHQVREIAIATARHFSLKLADLRGSSRRRPVVAARDVAMYLTRRITRASLYQIGQFFGGRDHTTVLHSCHKAEELVKDDPAVRQALHELQQKFQRG
jgi:chromosomal replication initiator protein